ncbi:hypothetical protein BHE97_11695 [Aeromicrobium sp. PE09-221]|uniref:helix-turn-helix domain-containing protein n=1 Tax=Aeromicrobium sp. PE09-221 TaxID=1898043 RepID=UPI000B3E9FB6|nr:AraC family transcriptional regulator [Aeromicrobium sp. PE09-221]OUZ09151.1 hypothetical protein BHE97_11695 [Aeromicrobium sp. PE09-221]
MSEDPWSRRSVGPQVDEERTLPVYAAGEFDVPFTIKGVREVITRDTRWAPHAHPTHELLWNTTGASTVSVEDRTWIISPGIGVWMPAGTVHFGVASAGTSQRATHFHIEETPALADEPMTVEITPLLSLLLTRLEDTSLSDRSRTLTEQLVFDVIQPSPHRLLVQVPSSGMPALIAERVLANPSDRCGLNEWARELRVSTRTIARSFRAQTGLSFHQWQTAVRAQHAIAYLADDLTVEEVAGLVGYSSPSAFVVAFRRATGLTPGRFRPSSGRMHDVASTTSLDSIA